MTMQRPRIAILGGTGAEGSGLAVRLARAGYRVTLGSRNPEKAANVCSELNAIAGGEPIGFLDNRSAAAAADVVVLTVPHAAQRATVEDVRSELAGKILVDATVPLVPPKVSRVQLPPEGSAGQIAQALLGENVKVVSAFQNVAAHHLQEGMGLDCDVLVCGDSKDARSEVIKLVEAAGMRGFHAGSGANAAAVEALTSLLIFINKQYECHAGIRLTGLDH